MNFSLATPDCNYPRNTIGGYSMIVNYFPKYSGVKRKLGLLPQYNLAECQIHPLQGILTVKLERFLIFDVIFRPFL